MRLRFPLLPLLSMLCLCNFASPRPAWAQDTKRLRIMCVGASITMGQGVNGGYRLPLEKMFEGAGIPVEFVGRSDTNSKGMTWPLHDGYPGHRIDQIEYGATNTFKVVSQPIADGVRELKPDAILVFCGTNDVRQNFKLDEAPQRLDHLIGTLHDAAPEARILVSSISPDLHFDDAVRRYNAGVASVVANRAAQGQKVIFVDNYNAVSAGTDILPDRTHLNAAGYMKVARNWFKVLAPNAPQIAFALSREGANEFAGKTCLGYRITMKRRAMVTDLGIYSAGKPLEQPRAAGIYDAAGTLLSKVEISPQDAPSGLFTFHKLPAPLILEAGKTYTVACNSAGLATLIGTEARVDPLHFEDPRFYFDHNVAVNMDGTDGTELKFPGAEIRDLNGGVGYFGPNFRLAPE